MDETNKMLHIAEIFVKKFKKKTVWYQRECMIIKGVFSLIDKDKLR